MDNTTIPRTQLLGHDIRLAEHGRNHWHGIAHENHTLEEALDPIYLWHRHSEIKPGDLIEVRHVLHHFWFQGYVTAIDAEAQAIRYHVLECRDFKGEGAKPMQTDLSKAEVVDKGGIHKWSVVLGIKTLKHGFATEEAAEAWLEKKKAA